MFFLFLGVVDSIMKFHLGEEAVIQLRKMGFPTEFKPYEGVYHEITPAVCAPIDRDYAIVEGLVILSFSAV